MKLSQAQKILIGIFTFLPFLLFPYYLFTFFEFFMEMMRHANDRDFEPEPAEIIGNMAPMFATIALLAMTSLGLLIFYIIHLVKNTTLNSTERLVWILLFVFAGMIAFPIYFFLRLVKDNPTS